MKTKMTTLNFLLGFVIGIGVMAIIDVFIADNIKHRKPYMTTTHTTKVEGNFVCTTHIESRDEPVNKYLVVTTQGEFAVPESFSLFHNGELLYIEDIKTEDMIYTNKYFDYGNYVKTYDNKIKDFNPKTKE